MLLLLWQAKAQSGSILGPQWLCQAAFCCAAMIAPYATARHASPCLFVCRISQEPILSQLDASEFTPEWDPLNPAFKGVAQVWAAAQEQAKALQGAQPAEQQAKQLLAQPKQAKPRQQQEVSSTAQESLATHSPRSPLVSGKSKLSAT